MRFLQDLSAPTLLAGRIRIPILLPKKPPRLCSGWRLLTSAPKSPFSWPLQPRLSRARLFSSMADCTFLVQTVKQMVGARNGLIPKECFVLGVSQPEINRVGFYGTRHNS